MGCCLLGHLLDELPLLGRDRHDGEARLTHQAEIRQLPDAVIPAVVIDAPLLIESGWNEVCQAVIFVDSPREQRLARAEQNRGWSPEEFARREASQMPIEQKRAWSTHAVRNAGSLAELAAAVDRFWTAAVA